MKKVFIILLSLVFILALTSCAGVREGLKQDLGINKDDSHKKKKVVREKREKVEKGNQTDATDASDIKIYRTKPPTRPYDEIGTVFANKYNMGFPVSNAKIEKKFKAQAARMNGHAVIITGADALGVTGVVIKFTDKEPTMPTSVK